MNEIKIETKYTVEDFIRTEKFLKYRRKPSGIIINLGGIFIFAFGLMNMCIAYIAMNNLEFWKAFFLLFLSILIFLSVYKIVTFHNIFLQLLLLKRQIKKHFDPKAAAYSQRFLTFNEKGISEDHKFGKSLTNWKGVFQVIETDEDFLFYLENSVRFQPKRDVANEQIALLRILIKANLAENATFQYITTD